MAFAYHVELTNACDLTCSYCSLTTSKRAKGLMSAETFAKVVAHMRRLSPLNFLILHHFGEPLLHPELPRFVRMAADAELNPGFSTNGVQLTRARLDELVEAGLKFLCVTFHEERGRQAYEELREHARSLDLAFWGRELTNGQKTHVREAMLTYGIERQVLHTFAGTVGEEIPREPGWRPPCDYLDRNFVCVLHDGRVVPCAMDERADNVLGTVDDLDAIQQASSYDLCRSCQGFQFHEGWRKLMGRLLDEDRFRLDRSGWHPSLSVDDSPPPRLPR